MSRSFGKIPAVALLNLLLLLGPGQGPALAAASAPGTCDAAGACEEKEVEVAEEALAASMRVEMLQVASKPLKGPTQAAPAAAEAAPGKDAAVLAQEHAELKKAAKDFCTGMMSEGFFCMGSSRVHCCMEGMMKVECGTETCMHGCSNNICIDTGVSEGYNPMAPSMGYNPMEPTMGYNPMMPGYSMGYSGYGGDPYSGYRPGYMISPSVAVGERTPLGGEAGVGYEPGYGVGVGVRGPEGGEVGVHVRRL